MISPGVAVQVKGFASRFQFAMYDLIVLTSTRSEQLQLHLTNQKE